MNKVMVIAIFLSMGMLHATDNHSLKGYDTFKESSLEQPIEYIIFGCWKAKHYKTLWGFLPFVIKKDVPVAIFTEGEKILLSFKNGVPMVFTRFGQAKDDKNVLFVENEANAVIFECVDNKDGQKVLSSMHITVSDIDAFNGYSEVIHLKNFAREE